MTGVIIIISTTFEKLLLVLLCSNADAEPDLSMVELHKTKTRNSLALDGALSSITTTKMVHLEPSPAITKASKKSHMF